MYVCVSDMKMTKENEKYHFHSAICARTVLCGEMIAVRTGRQKILLFSMLSFVCFSSLLHLKFLLQVFSSALNAFSPFKRKCKFKSAIVVIFVSLHFPFLYNLSTPAYVCPCAYETKKAILDDCRHSRVNENGWLCRSLILFVVVAFAGDPVNIRLSDFLNVTLS